MSIKYAEHVANKEIGEDTQERCMPNILCFSGCLREKNVDVLNQRDSVVIGSRTERCDRSRYCDMSIEGLPCMTHSVMRRRRILRIENGEMVTDCVELRGLDLLINYKEEGNSGTINEIMINQTLKG